jgi:hypothetical protein
VFGVRVGGGGIGFPVCKRKYKPFSSEKDVRVACHIHEEKRVKRVLKEGVRDYEIFFKELMVKEGVDVRGIGGVGKRESDSSKNMKRGMKGENKGDNKRRKVTGVEKIWPNSMKKGVKRKSETSGFKKGDRVEALYLSLGTFLSDMYPGTVFRANVNGTYDVKFDDGDRDVSVSLSSIRKHSDHVKKGDRVKALYRGSVRIPDDLYQGTVHKTNEDGTCDVKFDDGDRDKIFKPQNIRRITN